MPSIAMISGIPITTQTTEGLKEALTKARVQRFTWERLTRAGALIGPLRGTGGGRIEYIASGVNVHSRGAVSITEVEEVDWLTERIRCVINVEGYGPWGLGVYVAATPSTAYAPGKSKRYVELLGLETALKQIPVLSSYSLPAGTNAIAAAKALILSAGETAIAITDSTKTLSSARTWPAGTSILVIVNDLLDCAGYLGLWADGDGTFRASPADSASDRAVSWEFTPGKYSIKKPEFTKEEDIFSVPNVVVARTRGDSGSEGLTVTVTNDDPNSKYSTVYRGLVATDDSIITVEATDIEALTTIARNKLASLTNASSKVVVKSFIVPLVHNNAVRFVSNQAGIDHRHVVQRVTIDANPLGLMEMTLREVIL